MKENQKQQRCLRWSLWLLAVCTLWLGGCTSDVPKPGAPEYEQAVSSFFSGVAALQAGDNPRAEEKLSQAVKLAPGEPAAWANLGLVQVLNNKVDAGKQSLEKARDLAPNLSEVEVFLGSVASRAGQIPEAVGHFRKAVEKNPENLRALYSLARELERQGGPENEAEALRLMKSIVQKSPKSLFALLEMTRLAAKTGDAEGVKQGLAGLEENAGRWPESAQERYRELKSNVAAGNLRQAAVLAITMQNPLKPLPAYQQSQAALSISPQFIGEPIERLLKLPMPTPTVSPPDMETVFQAGTAVSFPAGKRDWVGAIHLTDSKPPVIATADARQVQIGQGAPLAFPGGPTPVPPSSYGVCAIDWNYDYLTDIALAGQGGLKLYQQSGTGTFADVTARAGLPPTVTGAKLFGAWALDMEMEGDLDLILGQVNGPTLALRNNGDGTFKVLQTFAAVQNLRAFVWADLDADGAPDAALLDSQGKLHIFANERSGFYRERALPPMGATAAVTVADLNNDGVLDLAVLADRKLWRLSDKNQGKEWDMTELGAVPDAPDMTSEGAFRLFAADFDNNGSVDLAVSAPKGGKVMLSDQKGSFQPLPTPVQARLYAAADPASQGRVGFLAVTEQGPTFLENRGKKNYRWQILYTRSAKTSGDQRINSFGIGGEVQLRSGLQVQMQPITAPRLHFGLGERESVDVARIIWPNGSVQAEFDLKADQVTKAEQRLKGSCPWLFTYNGREMEFVTDFIWRSPLGLKINAQDTAGVAQTEDWVKIRGDQLVAKDGFYDVRITADLWETHFFDHVSLMTVDHPENTEIFVDERFAIPPPELKAHVTTPPRPVQRVQDDGGRDVTEYIRAKDGRYLDFFGRGRYQGVTRDHYIEIEIGDDAPRAGLLWLVAYGWVHPTDSSINVAIGQGKSDPPKSLSMEVADGKGGWTMAKTGLGFPSGKNKTVLLRLDDAFRPGAPRRLRLRTNLEIYWDCIQWAQGLPSAQIKMRRLSADTAELRYRGFSVVNQADESSPELPDYSRIKTTTQVWRDLIGFYTRFGDVRELLAKTDDRYVIMNAGDEMAFRFAAPAPPPAGWKRDYVMIGDGWVKDGDYNTTFSKTVLPLPYHGQKEYNTPPGRLEDDPVYKRFPKDWETYHTRYVTPDPFRRGIWSRREEPTR
jgi:tetratricopeptide (TPR) repeat protein